MATMLLLKAHVKGHTRKDGVFVGDYETKIVKKQTYLEKCGQQGGFPGFGSDSKPVEPRVSPEAERRR